MTLFARNAPVLETDALAAKRVLCVGLGSGGSTVADLLARSGVGRFVLWDNDSLEPHNVARHVCSARADLQGHCSAGYGVWAWSTSVIKHFPSSRPRRYSALTFSSSGDSPWRKSRSISAITPTATSPPMHLRHSCPESCPKQ